MLARFPKGSVRERYVHSKVPTTNDNFYCGFDYLEMWPVQLVVTEIQCYKSEVKIMARGKHNKNQHNREKLLAGLAMLRFDHFFLGVNDYE